MGSFGVPIAIILIAVTAPPGFGQDPDLYNPDPVAMLGLASADTAFVQAVAHGGTAGVEKLLDTEFTWTDASGKVQSRTQVLRQIPIPSEMARQIGTCHMSLVADLGDPDLVSQWTAAPDGVEICVATEGREAHDIAMELLVCLGQALWEKLTPDQLNAYWQLLDAEFQAAVTGEIDDEALAKKRMLLRNRFSARSRGRLQRYGRASFAGTAAEYVHCLWHDVNVVSGVEHLPVLQLQRRLELLARWFPPNAGYRLYPCISRPETDTTIDGQ